MFVAQKLFETIVRHKYALIFALFAGVLSVAPYLLAVFHIGDAYAGVPFLYVNNENYYLGRIQEIFDGHGFVASPFFYEYKSALPLMLPIGEYFYAALAVVTGLTLAHTLVAAKFLFPAILFFLAYILVRDLTKEHAPNLATLAGLSCGMLVVVGIGLVDYNDVLSRLLYGSTSPALSFWTRPVNPITGGLLLFSFLIMLSHIKERSWKFSIAAGIVLCAMIGYIFSFGIGLAVLGTLGCFALLFHDYESLKKLILAGGIALSIISLYSFFALPSLGEGSLERSGLLAGHAPLLNKMTLAALAAAFGLLVYAYRARSMDFIREHVRYKNVWFSLALLIGSFAALNQQILTGISIWPYHLVQYTVPLAIVAVITIGTLVIGPHYPRMTRLFLGLGIAASVAFGIWNATTYTIFLDDFRTMQAYAPVFAWLNTNAEPDCVVLSADDDRARFTNFVPAFTHCNIYMTANIGGPVPGERILHNYLARLRLIGIKPEDAEEYMTAHQGEILASFHKNWTELFAPGEKPRITAMIPGLAEEYREFSKKDLRTAFETYRVNYLVDAEPTTETIDPAVLSGLHAKKIFEHAGIVVYAL